MKPGMLYYQKSHGSVFMRLSDGNILWLAMGSGEPPNKEQVETRLNHVDYNNPDRYPTLYREMGYIQDLVKIFEESLKHD